MAAQYDGKQFQDGCFKVGWGCNLMTKSPCADKGHWLSNTSLSNITIIDTPGFPKKGKEEQRAIDVLVNKLKNEIKYIPTLNGFHSSGLKVRHSIY